MFRLLLNERIAYQELMAKVTIRGGGVVLGLGEDEDETSAKRIQIQFIHFFKVVSKTGFGFVEKHDRDKLLSIQVAIVLTYLIRIIKMQNK